MNKEQKNQLDICFAKQFTIIKDIMDNLEADLYEYYDAQAIKVEQHSENDENLKKKISNLEKIKTDLIKIYCKLILE